MGSGGGAEEARKSMNLKNTNSLSISLSNKILMVERYTRRLTETTSNTNIKVDLKISGSLTVLFNIFLIICPLNVWNPVLITIA